MTQTPHDLEQLLHLGGVGIYTTRLGCCFEQRHSSQPTRLGPFSIRSRFCQQLGSACGCSFSSCYLFDMDTGHWTLDTGHWMYVCYVCHVLYVVRLIITVLLPFRFLLTYLLLQFTGCTIVQLYQQLLDYYYLSCLQRNWSTYYYPTELRCSFVTGTIVQLYNCTCTIVGSNKCTLTCTINATIGRTSVLTNLKPDWFYVYTI